MCSCDPKEWRKKRIGDITSGGGAVTDLSLKASIDVMNSVVEELVESIDKSSKSSARLSLVVAIATGFLAVIGIFDLCIRLFHGCAKIP